VNRLTVKSKDEFASQELFQLLINSCLSQKLQILVDDDEYSVLAVFHVLDEIGCCCVVFLKSKLLNTASSLIRSLTSIQAILLLS